MTQVPHDLLPCRISLEDNDELDRVVLKTINFTGGHNYHVRPAEPSCKEEDKFSSDREAIQQKIENVIQNINSS